MCSEVSHMSLCNSASNYATLLVHVPYIIYCIPRMRWLCDTAGGRRASLGKNSPKWLDKNVQRVKVSRWLRASLDRLYAVWQCSHAVVVAKHWPSAMTAVTKAMCRPGRMLDSIRACR